MPALKPLKQAEDEKLEKSSTYSLKDADRPLSPEEQEAEDKAENFAIIDYPRIKPIPGTLAFMLRNVKGGNDAVMEFLNWTLESDKTCKTQNSKFIATIKILWKNMDEYSRRRVDIFDILCRKFGIRYSLFWGMLQEGMFIVNEQIAQTALSGHKPEFINRLMALANKDRHHQDRRLLSDVMKLTENSPQIKVDVNNSKNIVNNTQINFPSFSESIRRSERVVEHRDIRLVENSNPEPRQLTEGKQDYIEAKAEITNEEIEEQLLKIAKKL